jgi:hypothetical protein
MSKFGNNPELDPTDLVLYAKYLEALFNKK